MGCSGARKVLGRAAGLGASLGVCLLLANCGNVPKTGVAPSQRVAAFGKPIPKGGGTYRVGDPYTIGGRTYVPQEDSNYRAVGTASWYGADFHGRLTANGEIYDTQSISAAHPTLPLPSYARVTNLENNRSLIVRVNDRGPFHDGRVIDLSVRAAKLLGFYDKGLARVRVEYVGRASLAGSDDRKLATTLRFGASSLQMAKNDLPAAEATGVISSVPAYAPASQSDEALTGRGLY